MFIQFILIFLLQFAFPNPQYRSSPRLEHSRYFFIMPYVPFSLFLPVFLMIRRTSIPAVMSMPEAAVYKYGDFSLWKHKIRMALHRVIPPPACDSVLLENLNQPKFGTLIFLDLTFRIMSDRFSASNTSATTNHLASNSMRRLGSVSASSTILLYRVIMSESVEFRFASSKKLCS